MRSKFPRHILPYASGICILLELVGTWLNPTKTHMLGYLWMALIISGGSLLGSVLFTSWRRVADRPAWLKGIVVLLLFCGVAVTFSFIYTLLFCKNLESFAITSDISSKEWIDESDRIVARIGGGNRLAFATAVAILREPPGAEVKFAENALNSDVPPQQRAYFRAVGSGDKQGIEDALNSLRVMTRFSLAEGIRNSFVVPDYSDQQISATHFLLIEGLRRFNDNSSVSEQLHRFGWLENLPPEEKAVYEENKDQQARQILQSATKGALLVLEAADESSAEDRRGLKRVQEEAQTWETHLDFLYFSFSTVTISMFGDITPRSWEARVFVIAEVLVGVYVLSVLLSAFLGWAPSDGRVDKEDP